MTPAVVRWISTELQLPLSRLSRLLHELSCPLVLLPMRPEVFASQELQILEARYRPGRSQAEPSYLSWLDDFGVAKTVNLLAFVSLTSMLRVQQRAGTRLDQRWTEVVARVLGLQIRDASHEKDLKYPTYPGLALWARDDKEEGWITDGGGN